ncbi:MAG TPA: D-glycerate dehydrogenase [Patescibacteria group bacterium]|nr:D-glycerate dehydrogenase [Patescibacteria group bacterium]
MPGKPKILVTRHIPYLDVSKYEDVVDIEFNHEEIPLSDQRLSTKMKEIEGLLCFSKDIVNGEMLESAPLLRVISQHSTDYPNIDLNEATKRGVYVTYLAGETVANAVAELTMGMIVAVTRKMVEAHNMVVQGEWKHKGPAQFLSRELKNKVLGIVGLGEIGRLVAKLAKGFDMKLLYSSRTRKPYVEKELSIGYVDLERLLRESDIVTLHVKLTNETHHMIGEEELRLMKTTAYLVNTSRGKVVDEKALISALESGQIAGAALDVFEKEPLEANNPLVNLKNALLAPHIGGATEEARRMEIDYAINNIILTLRGEIPEKLANPEVLKSLREKK